MLDPKEKIYCELVVNSTKNLIDIIKEVWPELKAPQRKLTHLNKKEEVQKEIERIKEINRYSVSYTESDIISKLLREADDPSNNGNARITAIVWLGKHIGMFQEKKQEENKSNITYNIINYSNDERIEDLVNKNKPNKKEIEESESLIEIEDYSLIKNNK